jgi:quinol monooxygenase YgiN
MTYRHIVLFTLKPEVDATTEAEIMRRLEHLGGADGVQEWMIARSLDERKGVVIIENAAFRDEATFKTFRTSPGHREIGQFMRELADWVVGDYIEADE